MAVLKGSDGSSSPLTPDNKYGVWGQSDTGYGVASTSAQSSGVQGWSIHSCGVAGRSYKGLFGVSGRCDSKDGTGVYGMGGWTGVLAKNTFFSGFRAYLGAPSVAGDFYDDIYVHGKVTTEVGVFKIDHPLDPANKYLSHSFVNSPDMKNIYDGIVTLDANGKAEVKLPEWFGEVNKDFRYQLTAIGASGPNLYIEEEISNNHFFKIAGGKHEMKVSWQVTGIRKDPWANATVSR
jgi:hypothetical protein